MTLVPIDAWHVRSTSAPIQAKENGEWPPVCRNGWKWSEIAIVSQPCASAWTANSRSSRGANCSLEAL